MTTHSETRKLAAVMFADIEGYTSLFQRNEDEGLLQIERHRQDLKEVIAQHNGQIIKFYGDGSLTLFNSIIEAARAALELQKQSVTHQIPLRIGIHMGEMIEKENDVYGDAVNVTSRIQAVGEAGSILVSKIVADELQNHPDIRTTSLGTFNLKNVLHPVEVFGLYTAGSKLPRKLPLRIQFSKRRIYMLVGVAGILLAATIAYREIFSARFGLFKDECVFIPPFTSHVTNPDYRFFPQTISSLLTKRLRETGEITIIDDRAASYYTNADLASVSGNPATARKMGATYVVQGNFMLEGENEETLRVWMTVMDVSKNRGTSVAIPDILCASKNKTECIQEASNALAGYLKGRKDYLFQFTNDSAYTAYIIAQNKWAKPDAKAEIKSYLLKAIRFDPKFIDAWFLLTDFLYNENKLENAIDTIKVIRQLFPNLEERKEDYLRFYETDFEGKYIPSFQSFNKEYKQNQIDLFINTTGMVLAMENLNDPLTALQMFNKINQDSIDLISCTYCLTRFNIALQAYTDIRDYTNAGKLASRMKPHVKKQQQFIGLLKFYMAIEDTVGINDVIRLAVKSEKKADAYIFYNLCAAQLAAVNGNISLRDKYARNVAHHLPTESAFTLAKANLLLGHLREAEDTIQQVIKKNPSAFRTYAYLGVTYARQGNEAGAEKMIAILDTIKVKTYPGEIPYLQARIKANMGQQTSALQYLKEAMEDGIKFWPTITFLGDPDMVMMNSNPDYLALIASRRQYKFE